MASATSPSNISLIRYLITLLCPNRALRVFQCTGMSETESVGLQHRPDRSITCWAPNIPARGGS